MPLTPSRASLAPTGFVPYTNYVIAKKPVGASLLAMNDNAV
jgi:hypothetical protein